MTEIWVCFCVFFSLLRPNNKNAECTVFLLFLCIYCCFWLDIEIRFRLPAAKQFDGYSMCECMIIMCIGIGNGIRFASYTHISNKRTWIRITNTLRGSNKNINWRNSHKWNRKWTSSTCGWIDAFAYFLFAIGRRNRRHHQPCHSYPDYKAELENLHFPRLELSKVLEKLHRRELN